MFVPFVLAALTAVAGETFEPGRFFVGCNYWGSQAGVHMWRAQDWNEKEVEKDIAALADSGVEVMRVFPTWPEFQPIVVNLRAGGTFGGYLDEATEKPLKGYAGLDDAALARFRFFCDTAGRHNVKLMVSLVTGWMSGRLFIPRALEGKNLITDPEAIMLETRFVREFVRAMKDHPAIVAWDLGNECNNMGFTDTPAQAWVWLNSISSAIRAEDPSRLVISGMHGIKSDFCATWNMQAQGELLDMLTPHPYPAPWRVDANRGPFNGFRNALHQVGLCLFYEGVGRKRAFPQEVGSFGPTITPDETAAAGYRQQMFASWQHGLAGFLWWCAFRQTNLAYPPFELNAMERELGMLSPDGNRTPFPQAKALKAFKAFKDSLPFRTLPPRKVDAVCILSEHEDFWQTSFGALMLAKQAGFDLTFVGAETTAEWPEARLYILPSGKDWETYTHSAWKRAVACAEEKGATLLVSRGGSAGYSGWERVSGQRTQMYREAREIDFTFDGRKLHGVDDFTTLIELSRGETLAADRTGNPVVTSAPLGKGRVIAVNFALANLVMTKLRNTVEGDFSNELWRIYAYAAKEAGVVRRVRRADAGLVVTEHPRTDAPWLVCALNTHADTRTFELSVDGTVGRVWNGTFADGKLTVSGNDGCIFELK